MQRIKYKNLTSHDLGVFKKLNEVFAEAFEDLEAVKLYQSMGTTEEPIHFDIPVLK